MAGTKPAGGPAASPFRFSVRNARLDWRLLAELDCDRIWRETDIDALERALDTVCYGDITVEDPRHVSGTCVAKLRVCRAASVHFTQGLTESSLLTHSTRAGPSMAKLFRLAQMQVEYLLHVQARPTPPSVLS
jgi:Iguana/Dzip1-like DAZ-interacting protein N-terminal